MSTLIRLHKKSSVNFQSKYVNSEKLDFKRSYGPLTILSAFGSFLVSSWYCNMRGRSSSTYSHVAAKRGTAPSIPDLPKMKFSKLIDYYFWVPILEPDETATTTNTVKMIMVDETNWQL